MGFIQIDGQELIPSGHHFVDDQQDIIQVVFLLAPVISKGTQLLDPVPDGSNAPDCQIRIKISATDSKIGGVKFQRLMELEPAQLDGCDNIGCRMGLGEHVLNLQTAVYVPLGYVVILQHLDPLRGKGFRCLTLTGVLHDLERLLGLDPLI